MPALLAGLLMGLMRCRPVCCPHQAELEAARRAHQTALEAAGASEQRALATEVCMPGVGLASAQPAAH